MRPSRTSSETPRNSWPTITSGSDFWIVTVRGDDSRGTWPMSMVVKTVGGVTRYQDIGIGRAECEPGNQERGSVRGVIKCWRGVIGHHKSVRMENEKKQDTGHT